MNITELARILKITPQELRTILPRFGFDIGLKAIKINKTVANKIIKEWPGIRKRIEKQKEIEARKAQEEKKAIANLNSSVKIPNLITIRDFANVTGASINKILSELMKSGIFASLNEKIDFDTAWLVGSSLGVEVLKKNEEEDGEKKEDKLKQILGNENKKSLLERPPVIVVMGHVDHGKTSLLDAIRKTNVIGGEAGGITQHIGAYQVVRNEKTITFIDTPGHEAFTAMRSRGAKIADIAILVVAADDGVKPQTIEAFRIIEAAKIPFVVAINKIDKAEANIEKTKQELSSRLNILPEDWGGKIICTPISAKQNTGIIDLLDMVLLTTETELENMKANPDAKAAGTVIESHINKGAGPVATILIQNGTIRVGDGLMLDGVDIGKVRALNNYKEEKIISAGPATPVQIIGLREAPRVGDILQVGVGEKQKGKRYKSNEQAQVGSTAADDGEEKESVKKINIIIKSDMLGSAEAIEESLEKINTDEIKVKIIHKGLGNVTEGDVMKAETSGAIIAGFNIKIPASIETLAREKKVMLNSYNIIYDLINNVKAEMEKRLDVKIEKKEIGTLNVLAIFITEKGRQVVGGKVISGEIEPGTIVEVMRKGEFAGEGQLSKIQSGKQDVNKMEEGNECGLEFKGKVVIEEGDVLVVLKEIKTIGKVK